MNVLEKILEEIEERIKIIKNIPVNEDDDFLDGEECYEDGRTQGRFEELLWCRDIICSHKDEIENDGWIPVEDTDRTPKGEDYILVSFSNFSLADIARYEEDEEGGIYYPGDEDKPYKEYGLFVNAWQPLPKPYRPKEKNNE